MPSNRKRWLTLSLLCLTVHASVALSGDWSKPRTRSTGTGGSWSRPIARHQSWSRPTAVPERIPPRTSVRSAPIVTLQRPIPTQSHVRGQQHHSRLITRGQSQDLPTPTRMPPASDAVPTVTLGPPPQSNHATPHVPNWTTGPAPGHGPAPALVSSAPANCDCSSGWSGLGIWSDDAGYCDAGCGMDCGMGCDMWAGRDNRWFLSAEYLLWDIKNDSTPPLITTGISNVNNLIPGALSGTSTLVLFGGDLDTDAQGGGRFRGGLWFNPDHTLGIEGGYYFLGQEDTTFTAATNGTPLLAVPFFNANTGLEDRVLLASPGTSSGSARVDFSTEFWGTDLNLRTNMMMGPRSHIDFLAGFRAMGLDESLNLHTSSMVTATSTTTQTWDRFMTCNRFYGGQVGAHAEFRFGRWAVELTGKLGIGNVHQSVSTIGNTIVTDATGNVTNTVGGIFTQQSNILHQSRNDFALVPEGGVKLNFQLCRWMRANVGYNFIYWSSVVRPGDQIDRNVNLNQPTSGPAQPALQFNDSDFWAQGLSTGLELRW